MIRAATPDDVPTIVQLIGELAEYEKLAHEVVIEPQALHEHLFGAKPVAEVLIAEQAGQPVGFALFFTNYSTFVGKPGLWLEDLFVRPNARGHGHGKALFLAVSQLAVDRNYGRMEWSVLDWNEPSIRFYQSMGAIAMDEWTNYRLTPTALRSLVAQQQPGPSPQS
ncbi:GNAT family N-acetyltransferase [Tuwongella immobilis]|uniref:N-acetyltransferase domain-containing protein n=1 Tax=Tuwongella immobilis TaxID=692036 RepID=A0A6C2YUK3_9BACT|nr:GNAT family N-acetyltransferase [Tuwongella immobilis]VIP04833.1 diamine acetyltransferase : Diamine acetyltransferase OS=Cystobacter violaceus Cb vi76 GN=Q664_09050 PE=4 SV=1: Acetyltransf_1 [Tuwongella immobilis]VTS07026.1 diamine acetyltransferase : Diamine acetyltransferase OS=Cystobacter violaceus Cb vi76 GN=Q664_09050 PE=4 SV=1: Acetyltransf_1 [Tuwongella immobilis]